MTQQPLVMSSPFDAAAADDALSLWSGGRDTAEIAAMLGKPEALVANELPKFLERRREAKRWLEGAA